MAAKPRFRIRSTALAVIATTIASLAFASASLADTGSVYFDTNGNAAAGFTNDLFNGSFTGIRDVGLGPAVMPNITSGNNNTAIGTSALDSETTGLNNTAIGTQALEANDVGQNNVATGLGALTKSTSGNANLATGDFALELNTTGELNVGDGYFALSANTTGNSNTALGSLAGSNLTTGSKNIDIANAGVAGETGVIRIGTQGTQKQAFLAAVSGKKIAGPAQPVLVNAQGQLGTKAAASAKSSARVGNSDRKLRAKVNRLQRAVRQLRAEMKRGR